MTYRLVFIFFVLVSLIPDTAYSATQDSTKSKPWPFKTYVLYTQVPIFDSVWCSIEFKLDGRFKGNSTFIKKEIQTGLKNNKRTISVSEAEYNQAQNKLQVIYSFTKEEVVQKNFQPGSEQYQYQIQGRKTMALMCTKQAYYAQSVKPLYHYGAERSSRLGAEQTGQAFFKGRISDGLRYMLPVEIQLGTIEQSKKGPESIEVTHVPFPEYNINNGYIIPRNQFYYTQTAVDITNAFGRYSIKSDKKNRANKSIEIKKKKDRTELLYYSGKENLLVCIIQMNAAF